MVTDFDDRVTLYNQPMRYLTRASTAVDLWRHRGGRPMWAVCEGFWLCSESTAGRPTVVFL